MGLRLGANILQSFMNTRCKVCAPPTSGMGVVSARLHLGGLHIPYSRKYWRELNLVVEPKIAIARILANLNLAVWYGIAIRIYASREFWPILNLAVVMIDRQTAKFSGYTVPCHYNTNPSLVDIIDIGIGIVCTQQ
jgi:hypothetical protein